MGKRVDLLADVAEKLVTTGKNYTSIGTEKSSYYSEALLRSLGRTAIIP